MNTETQYCVIPLCEREAVTERGQRHLCAQCAQAFDVGVEYAKRTPAPSDTKPFADMVWDNGTHSYRKA